MLERIESQKLVSNEWNECLAGGQPSSASQILEREPNNNESKPEFSQVNDVTEAEQGELVHFLNSL